MMPIRGPAWDLVLFVCVLVGFGLLALASDREGRTVTGQSPSLRRKRLLRAVGWPVLVLALTIGVIGWRGNFGTVVWLGWLTVAALILVFGIALVFPAGRDRRRERGARRPGAPKAIEATSRQSRPATARLATAASDRLTSATPGPPSAGHPARRSAGQVLGVTLAILGVLLLPIVFAVLLWRAPPHPMAGPGVVRGQVGPWSFELVEESPDGPEPTPAGDGMKHLILRFCDRCEGEIRAVYVQGRAPWSVLSRGLRFTEGPGPREALLAIPASRRNIDAVWITAVGKDGSLHRVSLPLEQVMPVTAAALAAESGTR